MKKKQKKYKKNKEELTPKKKEKRFSRSQVKGRLQDWENSNWEKFGSDDVKGDNDVTRND
jgi:hypothetical protein